MLKYSYYDGPAITFNYELLDSPMEIWPAEPNEAYSPLAVIAGWYWPAINGNKVSLKDVRSDITSTFNLDAAINIILNECGIEYVGEAAGVVFTGNGTVLGPMHKMIPHVHAPVKEYNYEKCPNLTVVVPIKIVEPVTEEFCIKHYDYVPWDQYDYEKITHDEWLAVTETLDTTGEVTRIKLPEQGQYLVVEFEGSRDYHWIDNISNNHYLYFILEGHVK